MEASSRSGTKAFNFVFYCTIALCGQNSRAAELKKQEIRSDSLLCDVFPFSCTSVIKSGSGAHTCVPVGNARHADCYTTFTFRAPRAETRSHTRTHTPWVWVWLRGYLPALWFRHASLFWSLVTHKLSSPSSCCVLSTFLYQCSAQELGAWPRSTKGLIAALKPCRNVLVGGPFHLPHSWVPLHWDAQIISAPQESCLFTCLTSSSRLNDVMTDDDQIYPPRSPLRVRVCAPIRGPHTPASTDQCSDSLEHPELLEAYISPYQRTLITPSMSEQIHVHTSIHKAPLTHSVCPPSPTFLLLLFARIWLHTHGAHSDTCIHTSLVT